MAHGREAGAALAEHPDVDKISFTGSTATGKQILKLAAGSMKAVTLETGGKSPLIVFEDADLKNAIKWGALRRLRERRTNLYIHSQDLYSREDL